MDNRNIGIYDKSEARTSYLDNFIWMQTFLPIDPTTNEQSGGTINMKTSESPRYDSIIIQSTGKAIDQDILINLLCESVFQVLNGELEQGNVAS